MRVNEGQFEFRGDSEWFFAILIGRGYMLILLNCGWALALGLN